MNLAVLMDETSGISICASKEKSKNSKNILKSSLPKDVLFKARRSTFLKLYNKYSFEDRDKWSHIVNCTLNREKCSYYFDFKEIKYEENKSLVTKFYKKKICIDKLKEKLYDNQFFIWYPKIVQHSIHDMILKFHRITQFRRSKIVERLMKKLSPLKMKNIDLDFIQYIEKNNIDQDSSISLDTPSVMMHNNSHFIDDEQQSKKQEEKEPSKEQLKIESSQIIHHISRDTHKTDSLINEKNATRIVFGQRPILNDDYYLISEKNDQTSNINSSKRNKTTSIKVN